MRDRTALGLTMIVVLALALRLLPVAGYGEQPGLFMDSDSRGYHRLACNLLAGHGYSWDERPPYTPNLYRPPGLPVLLAGLYALVGPSVTAAVVLQALVAALTVALTFFLARVLTGRPGLALAAAAVQAVDPVGILYCDLLLTEVYSSLVVVALALAVARYWQTGRSGWLTLSGGVLAVGILVHPVLLFLPLILPVIPLLRSQTRTARQLTAGAVGLCIALAPAAAWVARNRHVGDYTGVSSVAAVNLLKYKAAGVEAELRGTSREAERDRLTAECEALLPPGATPGQRFRLWQRRGTEILLAHPLICAKVHLRGMVVELFGPDRDHVTRLLYGPRVLDGLGSYSDATIEAARRDRPVPALDAARRAVLAGQAALALSLLVGLAALVRARQWGLLAVLLAVPAYVLLLSGGPEAAPRFRVIYLPALSLLSALGAATLADATRRLAVFVQPVAQPAHASR